MIRKWRVGYGWGSLDCETLWSESLICSDGEDFWFEKIDRNAGFRQHY